MDQTSVIESSREVALLIRILSCTLLVTSGLPAQMPVRSFSSHCAICHGGDAGGSDRAPAILGFVGSHSDAEIAALVHAGRLEKGMPKFDFTDAEMAALVKHLRGLRSGEITSA